LPGQPVSLVSPPDTSRQQQSKRHQNHTQLCSFGNDLCSFSPPPSAHLAALPPPSPRVAARAILFSTAKMATLRSFSRSSSCLALPHRKCSSTWPLPSSARSQQMVSVFTTNPASLPEMCHQVWRVGCRILVHRLVIWTLGMRTHFDSAFFAWALLGENMLWVDTM
jgi:hypothetical protein